MSVGYSAFAKDLQVDGKIKITGTWDVKITNVKIMDICSDCEGTPTFSDSNVDFNATLIKPGDEITYEITILNAGTIAATLNDVEFSEGNNGSSAIKYTYTSPDKDLAPLQTTTMLVTVFYDKDTTTIPTITTKSITGKISYKQK